MLKKAAYLTTALTVALFIAVPGSAFAGPASNAGDGSSVDAHSQYLAGSFDGSVDNHLQTADRAVQDTAGSGAFEDAHSQYLAAASDMIDGYTGRLSNNSVLAQADDSEDAYSQYLAGEFCVAASRDLVSLQ